MNIEVRRDTIEAAPDLSPVVAVGASTCRYKLRQASSIAVILCMVPAVWSVASIRINPVPDDAAPPDPLITFADADYHADTPQDGLYALAPKLTDPECAAKAAAFLAASVEGWKYAVAHPDEAAKIIVDNDPAGVAVHRIQLRQKQEIAGLVGTGGKGVGDLEPKDADQTVDSLYSGGSAPVITKKPEGAWTHAVWDKAMTEVK